MSFCDFQVGETIRSDHFAPAPHRGECFIEGVILERIIGGVDRYLIRVTREVWCGEEKFSDVIGSKMACPMRLHREWPDRLRRIADAEPQHWQLTLSSEVRS